MMLASLNPLLKAAVNILIHNNYSIHVLLLHVPGEENIVADALSCVRFSVALNSEPNLKLDIFTPPFWRGHQNDPKFEKVLSMSM